MADRPLIDHDYKTPLEYANTPNMDRLAKAGLLGQLDPVAPGVRPGSDVANLALLGYDPAKYYTGRGALEAMGAGFNLSPTDVAFRCNFATVDDDFRVEDRRAGRIRKGTSKLAKAVNEIKIDHSFVTGMLVDDNDAVIVRSTIDLARNLGLRVVAEGVEDQATWQRLAELGCDQAQGYYLSPPVAAAQLLAVLRHAQTPMS